MEEGTAEPDEDDGQVAEMGGEDPPRDLLKVARVSVEVVSVGVKVPNQVVVLGPFARARSKCPGLPNSSKVAGLSTFSTWLFASLPRSGGLMVIEHLENN